MIKVYVMGPHFARVKLWSNRNQIVYSTLPSQIGGLYPDNKELQKAFLGQTVWEVTKETESILERGFGKVIEVYIPLTWTPNEKPSAVLEVYLPYAPYARHLSNIRNAIFAAVAIVSLSLGVAFFFVYRAGVKSINRQRDAALQRRQEVLGLNKLLQKDLSHYLELKEGMERLRDILVEVYTSDQTNAPTARDASIVMRVKELADFAGNLPGAEERQETTKDEP